MRPLRLRQEQKNWLMIGSVILSLFLIYKFHPFTSITIVEEQSSLILETTSKETQKFEPVRIPVISDVSVAFLPGKVSSTEKIVHQDEIDVNSSIIYTLDQKDPRLIKFIRDHHLFHTSDPGPYRNMHPGVHPNSFSSYVKYLFRKKGPLFKGTFIEAGAYDGEIASNSLYLEETGWTGLLVECNPFLLPKLMAKNRKSWISNVCLSPTHTPKLMNFSSLQEWPASAKLGRPLNEAEMKKHGIDWVTNKTWINFEIPCFPLYSILKATGNLTEVDFLSLDVEGAEIEILKNFPFEHFKIKSMLVEVHTYNETQKTDLRNFLHGKGFKVAKIMENDDAFVLESENFPL